MVDRVRQAAEECHKHPGECSRACRVGNGRAHKRRCVQAVPPYIEKAERPRDCGFEINQEDPSISREMASGREGRPQVGRYVWCVRWCVFSGWWRHKASQNAGRAK